MNTPCLLTRAALLPILLCAMGPMAAGQTYDPRTGIAELPGSPVAPTSYAQCDALQRQWSQLSKAIEDAHQKCLDAHHREPEDPRASFSPSNPLCSHSECQSLHTARIEIGQKAKERVESCRAEVAQFQKKQQAAKQQLQTSEEQQQEQQAARQQALDQAEQQTLRSQENRREANEKIAAVLAANANVLEQNLRAIKRMQAAGDAPPTSAASSPVTPTTSGQLQMLQGLVMANSTDGNGNDANSLAALNALQQMGNQDNLNQQTRDTPTPAVGPCGVATPAGGTSRSGVSSGSPMQQGSAGTRQMFVAFAFSTIGLHGFGGDGACGVGIDSNEQKAMDQSGIGCALASQAPDWCGTANGGHYEVCRADGKIRWVAIAVNNDGYSLDWSDGEAIGALSQEEAEKSALANCGRSGCQLKWSGAISCTK